MNQNGMDEPPEEVPPGGLERAEPSDGMGGRRPLRSTRGTRLFLLLVLAGGAVYLLGLILGPLLPALVLSGVLAVLVRPAYRPFKDWLGRRDLAAALGTIVIFVGIFLPLSALTVDVVDRVRAGFAWAASEAPALLARGNVLPEWLNRAIDALGLDRATLTVSVQQQMQELAGAVAQQTLGVLSGLGGGLLQGGAALFTLFYFLRDGEHIIQRIEWLIPLDEVDSRALVQRARDVTYATLYGTIAVAAVQGILTGLAFLALGIEGAALWGVVTGVLALLPVVGPPFVWGPAALILMAQGDVARGVVLLLLGIFLVGTVDNVLRAYLMSERAQLHPLVVFLSVIGGLIAFGAVGIVLGPLSFVLALMILEMARLALEEDMGPAQQAPKGSGKADL